MSLIPLMVMLAIAGFAGWIVLQIPMPDLIKKIIIGIACFVIVIAVLQALGVNTGLPRMRLN